MLQAAGPEGERLRPCLVDVVDVQVQVHLLLLRPGRPLRREVIRGALDADDPFAVDDDAVPVEAGRGKIFTFPSRSGYARAVLPCSS